MSCRWCIHWSPDGGEYDADYGECRRYPAPLNIEADYVCGEFVCEKDRYGSDPKTTLMNGFYKRMREINDMYKKERQKRLTLEKKNKELRRKLIDT